jgi:F1F0 ATPase subunit 2
MSDPLTLILAFVAGLILGGFFFGGLWWTVRRGVLSKRPAVIFFGSLLLRTGIAVAGFYFVSCGNWKRLLLCLLGFVMARLVVTWLTRPSPANRIHPEQEAGHAP